MKRNGTKGNGAHAGQDSASGERGKFFRLQETQVMIPLDRDIVRHFQKLARKEKKAYYVLINAALRDVIQEEESAQDFTKWLRKMIVSEIEKSATSR